MAAKMIKVSLGTMEMGRNATVGDVPKKMVDLFLSKGDSVGADEIDTAFMYVGGKTEKVLGRFNFIMQVRIRQVAFHERVPSRQRLIGLLPVEA